jgi:hypothetical protein
MQDGAPIIWGLIMRKFLIAITLCTLLSTPASAQPVEYVRVCDSFGANFFYVPGTETCINVSTG